MSGTLSPLEQTKRTVNPYDGRAVFERLAVTGIAGITPEDDIVLRWHGLYQQRPKEAGRFMMRLKLPNGAITAEQLAVVARVAARVAQSRADITTRQNLQLHSVTPADFPDVFAEFDAVGLTTLGACGDAVRNVTGCPVAGLAADQVLDTLPLAETLTRVFLGNLEFANLPRKLKVALCGCATHCVPTEANDVGLVAAPGAAGEPAYILSVGGGLSAQPALAQPIGWLPEGEVVEVVTRIAEIFREHGNRENRSRARLKHLIALWGADRFREELESRLGRTLRPVPAAHSPAVVRKDHLGVHPQLEPERRFIGVPVPTGRLTSEQLLTLSQMAAEHGRGRLRLTHYQNIILADIAAERVPTVLRSLAAVGLPVDPEGWHGHSVVCTGREFCNKAVTETKGMALPLLARLQERMPQAPISLHINGCPHGCGQHALADIGLQGSAVRVEGGLEDRFDLWLGGDPTGVAPAFGKRVQAKVRPEELADLITRLVARHQAEGLPGETFSAFARRVLWPAAASK